MAQEEAGRVKMTSLWWNITDVITMTSLLSASPCSSSSPQSSPQDNTNLLQASLKVEIFFVTPWFHIISCVESGINMRKTSPYIFHHPRICSTSHMEGLHISVLILHFAFCHRVEWGMKMTINGNHLHKCRHWLFHYSVFGYNMEMSDFYIRYLCALIPSALVLQIDMVRSVLRPVLRCNGTC